MTAQLALRRIGSVLVHASLEPLTQLLQPLLQRDARPVAEHTARLGDVRETIADVPGPVVAAHLRLDVALTKNLAEALGDFQHTERLAAADVEHLVASRRGL